MAQIKEIFPNVHADVINKLLQTNNGDVEKTIEELLVLNTSIVKGKSSQYSCNSATPPSSSSYGQNMKTSENGQKRKKLNGNNRILLLPENLRYLEFWLIVTNMLQVRMRNFKVNVLFA